MKNVLHVLGRDLLRLLKAPAALVVVVVLVVLPSTYTWFNVIGFWNPYDNTGNMRVCVVNQDAGSENDLMGQMNLGNQIVDTLHENHQLKWEFTDYDDAMHKVESGEVYAAFVIPEDFTANLFTIVTGDFRQPNLQYYANEKMNPVSPKVTDAGSSTLDETINSQFVSTVSSVVADTLNDKVAEAEQNLSTAQNSSAAQLSRAVDSVSDARATVSGLAASTEEARQKAQSAKGQLEQARADAQTVQGQLQQVSDLSLTLQNSLGTFTSVAMPGMSNTNLMLSQVASQAAGAVTDASNAISGAQGTVDAAADRAQGVLDMNTAVIEQLQIVHDKMPDSDPNKEQLRFAIDSLTARNAELQRDLNDLKTLSGDVDATAASVAAAANIVNAAAQNAITASGAYQQQLFGSALPQVSNGISQVGIAAASLKGAISNQGYLIDETSGVIDQLSGTLHVASDAMAQTDALLSSLEGTMRQARNDVGLLGTSSAVSELMDNGRIDPEKIAEFMQAPTKVTTEKLYPLNAYGSAMAPLFISLSLWIGTLMLCVILKLEVDKEGVPGLTVMQGYIGRWLFFALLVTLQAVVCVAGCLLIGVQAASVPAFFATAILLSLSYLCITYTLSSSFQHIGIGLCIIMVFVQIPGGTGLYPVEMTDAFFRTVYPMFPFTYGINALRETIGGFYGTQWLGYCGVLLLIALSMALVGLFVRPHLTNLNRLVAKEIEQSDLLNVEEALVPERRYRIGQLIRALSDHDEFHNTVRQQADTFLRHYPRLKRGALILGIAVPVAVSVVFAVTTTEKVVILTAWLTWLVILIGFLLGLEMVRDNIQRQASIDSMSDDELRGHLADRGKKVVKELVPAAMSTARVSVPADRSARAAGVSVPLPPVGVAADDLADQPVSARGAHDAGQDAVCKPGCPDKGASLMDLAAKGKPAYFDGPFLTDEEAHGEKGEDDEELLEAEVPVLELSAEDLEALAQRKAERGKHGKKRKKHKKKGDSKKGAAMRNVFKLFSYDIKHLFGNVITVVIVLGLVFLPSIFTWYNVIACWNVFDNTGNLKVAVANSDEGYQSDLLPTKINVGDSVESALRANDQLDWVFTDEEDAIDGARSGKYYAAVVIPQSFSSDMMSFYSDDAEHAELVYYENEKKNAVAPRVTDQASSKVAAQVNTTFAETISDVALGLVDSLGTVADDADAAGRIAKLSGTISSSADQMRTAADVLESYANLAGTAQALVGSSTQLLGNAQNAVKDAQQQASGAKSGAETIGDALTTSVSSLSDALAQSSDGFNQVPDAIDKVYAQVDTDKANAAQSLRDQAADVDSQIERYQQLIEVLESIKPQLDEQYRPAVDAVVSQLNTSISSLGKLRDSLTSAADKIATGNDPESASRADIQAKLDEAKANADKLKNDYENNLKPGLESLASSVAQAAQSLSARASQLSSVGDGLNGAASSVASDLAGAQSAIRAMSDELHGSADKMSALSQRVNEALASGNVDQLKQIIGSNPEALAKAVSAPVGVERIAVFPVEDFGSAMAPLYTTLALWVGSLLIMVLLNPVPSERAKREAGLVDPKSWQLFFGRYGAPFVLAFMQSMVVCLGNMLFVGVQVADPLLYLLCFWTADFVFSFIIYTLVSLFANLGKALAVLLLIIYVTGGGGSFPLQLLPGFFQAVSPFLPATHVINAMRAASMGVYQNDFWVQIGITLAFIVPFVIMGILRPVLSRFTYWFVEQVEKSKVVA